MRTVPALTLFVAITALSSAWGQADSVTVNPQAGPGGAQVLYDPGTGQQRIVPPLLQPWQNNEPIRLHPPGSRHHSRAPQATSEAVASAPEAVARPRKARRTATAGPLPTTPPPAQQSAPTSGFSDFTDLISRTAAAPPPKKAAVAPPAKKADVTPRPEKPVAEIETPRVAPPVEKPVQRASIEPPKPARTHIAQGTPRDSIAFAPSASDPSTSAVAAVRSLAGNLTAALSDSNTRIQLMAYAGMRGEKSSDTRRLSLKRALVIRQLLIDDGVPSERIDVFALGGADDGPLDRVDVFVKS